MQITTVDIQVWSVKPVLLTCGIRLVYPAQNELLHLLESVFKWNTMNLIIRAND
jgi:hypothetical protein